MDVVERSEAYCSDLICVPLPIGLLVSFRGKYDLCAFLMVLKVHVNLMVEIANESLDPIVTS
jgi:hypothetical protein